MNASKREVIVVRSLAESDLGLFAAHRLTAKSKQRALNINADMARLLLSQKAFKEGGANLDCISCYGSYQSREVRWLGKSGKNWRLGGKKFEGKAFAELDCKDLVLIRTRLGNDGADPVTLRFVSKQRDRVLHAGLVAIVERYLDKSMAAFDEGEQPFGDLAAHCTAPFTVEAASTSPSAISKPFRPVLPMPKEEATAERGRQRTVSEKIRTTTFMEQMLRVAGDLSAPAQLRFMETVDKLATQLREVLIASGRIISLERSHSSFWPTVKHQRIGFVDGGLANLSTLGSAPIAARVGGYTVVPGETGANRERFIVLKQLIDELYAHDKRGLYSDSFPDIGALRDAARISIEAAGAVKLLTETDYELDWLFTHGALVNPVSRYTDVMRDGKAIHSFPNFSESAMSTLLPADDPKRYGLELNFINVHLRQLQLLESSRTVVCGVIERESTTNSVCRAVLESLDDEVIRDLLPISPSEWKHWFRTVIDPSGEDDFEGQRITDSLLFRCVLEPGEALSPVAIDRNEARRAPDAWKETIAQYPKPQVSYLQTTEWAAPVRIELFSKDEPRFKEIATLVLHCSLLLPRYAFPVGLDIVDKFAKVPNWMSRPINTHTTVRAMKTALDSGDDRLFDALRRMLCGSGREFLLRPSVFR